MPSIVVTRAIAAWISILAGYLRLITNENGNVDLFSYRFTGCLGAFLFDHLQLSLNYRQSKFSFTPFFALQNDLNVDDRCKSVLSH